MYTNPGSDSTLLVSPGREQVPESFGPKKPSNEPIMSTIDVPIQNETAINDQESAGQSMALSANQETSGQGVKYPMHEETPKHSIPDSANDITSRSITPGETGKPPCQASLLPDRTTITSGDAEMHSSVIGSLGPSVNVPDTESVKFVDGTLEQEPHLDTCDKMVELDDLSATYQLVTGDKYNKNVDLTSVTTKHELIEAYTEANGAIFGNGMDNIDLSTMPQHVNGDMCNKNVDLTGLIIKQEQIDAYKEANGGTFSKDMADMDIDKDIDNVSITDMEISDEEPEGYMRHFYCYLCIDDVLNEKLNKCQYCKPVRSTDKLCSYDADAMKSEIGTFRLFYKEGSCVICFGEVPDANKKLLYTLCEMCENDIDNALG